jgi:hypothetical protein
MAIGQIKSLIKNEITGAVNSIVDQLGFGLRGGYNSGAEGLMYPLELRSQADRPCIEFTAYDTSSGDVQLKTIWFPCPAGIEINDQATYNTIDLGALGGALNSAMEAAGGADTLRGAVGATANNLVNQVKSARAGEITALAAMALPGYGDKLQFNTDGSPLEVDITLSYQETRVLTRFDIETLGDDENRGIGSDGLATEQGTSEQDLARLSDQEAVWEQANNSNSSD